MWLRLLVNYATPNPFHSKPSARLIKSRPVAAAPRPSRTLRPHSQFYGQLLETALGIIRDAGEGYSAADPYVKRLWNRALMERIEIRAGQIARVELQEPFAGPFLVRRFK